ncbi:MAG: RHS repeat-associated core domain-containing protein, partial [Muribaculaceae bacterium]|nr:RHS repeat-associated core domain-containing protein [Muribaculaceae bacterium]
YGLYPGGFMQDSTYYWYVRDYQGNNVAVMDGSKNVLQETSYYPYGEPWREPEGQPWLYGGNERLRLDGINEYDFNARRYNSAEGRFSQLDPLCEKYPWLSPYAYCGGDPVNYSDPSGLDWIWNTTEGYIWRDNVTSKHCTPSGYSYIGPEDSDILNNLRIKEKTEIQVTKKIGGGMNGNVGGPGIIQGSANILTSVVSVEGLFSNEKPTFNNKFGRKFDGIVIKASVNQKIITTNEDYKMEFKGGLKVSYGDITFSDALKRDKNAQNIQELGTFTEFARILLPSFVLSPIKSLREISLNLGATNNYVFNLPVNIYFDFSKPDK